MTTPLPPALPLDWTVDALCGDAPDDWTWFSEAPAATSEAISICAGCPVKTRCLEAAMDAETGDGRYHRYGVFGGLTAHARWQLHLAREAAA